MVVRHIHKSKQKGVDFDTNLQYCFSIPERTKLHPSSNENKNNPIFKSARDYEQWKESSGNYLSFRAYIVAHKRTW